MRWIARRTSRWSGVVALVALWELAARSGWVDPVFVPPFTVVALVLWKMAASGALFLHVLVSAYRALAGLAVALVVGVPLGLALGFRWPVAFAVVQPFLRVLSHANPFALAPVFLLFFGAGEVVRVAVVVWGAMWPIVYYTITGARTIDPAMLKTARSLSLTGWPLVLRVVLPACAPAVFAGIRVASTLVFFMLVGIEMLGTRGGLGWFVHHAAMSFQIPGIYAGAVLTVGLGYALRLALAEIEARAFPEVRASLWPGEGPREPAGRFGRPQVVALVLAMVAIMGGGLLEIEALAAHERAGGVAPGLEEVR